MVNEECFYKVRLAEAGTKASARWNGMTNYLIKPHGCSNEDVMYLCDTSRHHESRIALLQWSRHTKTVLLAIPATIYMCRNDRVRGDDAPLRCRRRSERAFQLYAPPSVSVGLQDSLCMCLIVCRGVKSGAPWLTLMWRSTRVPAYSKHRQTLGRHYCREWKCAENYNIWTAHV